MKKALILIILVALAAPAFARGNRGRRAPAGSPFETRKSTARTNVIDAAVEKELRARRIQPARICSDAVFVRRAYLDVIGTLPTPGEVLSFLESKKADKRARLIDELLTRDEFVTFWTLKWSDWLRVKAEFPINLWPNAVQAYYRYLQDTIRRNRPFDRFAYEMLTASGSNFRVPAVNFCRAMQSREPAALAQMAALTFMGSRIELWEPELREDMAAFFSRVAYKRTIEWKEEIVFLSPAPAKPIVTRFPDGSRVTIPADRDPRQVFADWLIRADNPWFAKNISNRVWAWLMGRGIIHEPDDIRPDNPASNPELLEVLSRELILSDYDLQHLFRLILNSTTYQRSPIPRSKHAEAEALFSHAIVRRHDAEVLIDALCTITGTNEKYESPIPEPFTFIPEDKRSIELTDGSITSPFLEMFGRPSRDTGLWSERNNKATDGQRLHLLNSSDIQNRIERSWKLQKLLRSAGRDGQKAVRSVYLLILSRLPTEAEIAALTSYRVKARLRPDQVAGDLIWALINSKEFLYRH